MFDPIENILNSDVNSKEYFIQTDKMGRWAFRKMSPFLFLFLIIGAGFLFLIIEFKTQRRVFSWSMLTEFLPIFGFYILVCLWWVFQQYNRANSFIIILNRHGIGGGFDPQSLDELGQFQAKRNYRRAGKAPFNWILLSDIKTVNLGKNDIWIKRKNGNWFSNNNYISIPREINGYEEIAKYLKELKTTHQF